MLLRNPHDTKARYRLAQSLDGQGKTAEAFTEVTSLLCINPEVNHFMVDTVYKLFPAVQDCPTTYHELKGKSRLTVRLDIKFDTKFWFF